MSSLLLLSASLIKTRASTPPARASAARCAAGRRERKTCGLVAAAMSGIRSQRAGFARRAFTNGLRPSASLVLGGPRTPIGMQNSKIAKQHESSTTLAQRKSYLLDNGTGTRGLTLSASFRKRVSCL